MWGGGGVKFKKIRHAWVCSGTSSKVNTIAFIAQRSIGSSQGLERKSSLYATGAKGEEEVKVQGGCVGAAYPRFRAFFRSHSLYSYSLLIDPDKNTNRHTYNERRIYTYMTDARALDLEIISLHRVTLE